MSVVEFASYAWLLEGIGNTPGWLDLQEDRLRFTTSERIVFDVPRRELTSISFPWYYFGGGMKVSAAGRRYRVSFLIPNDAEFPGDREGAPRGSPARPLLPLASEDAGIIAGRKVGRRWRQLLGEAK